MRIIAFVIAMLVATSAGASQQEFCAGFERGYSAGYMRASGSGLAPLAPLCPLQPLKGLNDPASDFEHGYAIGFEEGLSTGR